MSVLEYILSHEFILQSIASGHFGGVLCSICGTISNGAFLGIDERWMIECGTFESEQNRGWQNRFS